MDEKRVLMEVVSSAVLKAVMLVDGLVVELAAYSAGGLVAEKASSMAEKKVVD
jgi:hypothetical protein